MLFQAFAKPFQNFQGPHCLVLCCWQIQYQNLYCKFVSLGLGLKLVLK